MAGLELQFDTISYVLVTLLLGVVVLPLVFAKEPDIHPFALHRQSAVAPWVARDCCSAPANRQQCPTA